MNDLGDDHDRAGGEYGREYAHGDAVDLGAPICGSCGVTALPSETNPDAFVCENPDCSAEEM